MKHTAPDQPSFALRGLHLNGWAFNHPYTFRCWTEAEWRRYIDFLADQRANLFFIWPFMEIIPLPLSHADRAYLREVRRVVDYARRHGMEVWIFQSPNRVALNDCGVRDPRHRPYWIMKEQGEYPGAGQRDLDPGDPKQFTRIMESRETLYRLVNNADGYCTIDSDPGGWHGSPLADFIKIFRASRAVMDRVCLLGKEAKLVNWLWSGWGQPGWWTRKWSRADQDGLMRKTIRAMKKNVPEPWGLIAGKRDYLPACAAEGVLGKTIYLPYNVIEGEPSRPGTQIDFGLQREHLDVAARYRGLAGLMGNVQTPLLQFPHVSHFLSTAWDYERRKQSAGAALRSAADRIDTRHRDLIVDAWTALTPAGRERAGNLSQRLERVVKQNKSGPRGRSLTDYKQQIAQDLIWQLKGSAAFDELIRAVRRGASKVECARRIEAFLAAALDWDHQHGWSMYWKKLGRPWTLWPDHDPAYPAMVRGLRKVVGKNDVTEFLAPIGRRLARRYDTWIVAQCAVAPLHEAMLKDRAAR